MCAYLGQPIWPFVQYQILTDQFSNVMLRFVFTPDKFQDYHQLYFSFLYFVLTLWTTKAYLGFCQISTIEFSENSDQLLHLSCFQKNIL